MPEDGPRAVLRALSASPDLEGLMPPSEREAAPGEVTSGRSLRLMQRVALVFADVTDDRSIREKLETAGCTQEQYFQLREMPEFKPTLHKALVDYIILPRAGRMLSAMTQAASMGDSRAFAKAMDFANMLAGASVEEMAEEMGRIQDEDAYAQEIFSTLKDVQQLISDLDLQPQEKEAQDEARQQVRKRKKPTRKRLLDHNKIRKEEADVVEEDSDEE